MRFDASLRERWRESAGAWTYDLPERWMQGRSVFGGLTAAAAAALGARHMPDERPLRTATFHLLRPTAPGPVEGRARVLREGKHTSFVQVDLHQGGEQTLAATLVHAAARPGALAVEAAPLSAGPGPEDLEDLPYIEGVMPEFLQHVSLRWATGRPPFSGGEQARFTGHCRFREPAGDAEGVLGLLDVWPCPSLSLLSAPAPASTVSWTAHVASAPADFHGWFGFEYETVAGQGGLHTVAGRLFAPDGRLVAYSEQLAAVFA